MNSWSLGEGAHPDAPGGRLQVLLLDGGDDVGGREAELGQLVGLQPDAHAVVGAAEEVDLGDAGDAQQLVAQVDAAVVDQEVRVVAARSASRARSASGCSGSCFLTVTPCWMTSCGRRAWAEDTRFWVSTLAMSWFDAHLEVDVELHAAVAGVRRLHVDHALDAVHLLLDRRRHRLLHRHGGGARVGGGHADGRRGEERVLLEAQPAQA